MEQLEYMGLVISACVFVAVVYLVVDWFVKR